MGLSLRLTLIKNVKDANVDLTPFIKNVKDANVDLTPFTSVSKKNYRTYKSKDPESIKLKSARKVSQESRAGLPPFFFSRSTLSTTVLSFLGLYVIKNTWYLLYFPKVYDFSQISKLQIHV